jgi:hypothetical protein
MGLITSNDKKYSILDMDDNIKQSADEAILNLMGDYVAFVDNEYETKKVAFEFDQEMTLYDIVVTVSVEFVEKANLTVKVEMENVDE